MTLSFSVHGEPIPQGSMKAFVHAGRAVLTSDNPRLKAWRRTVADAAQRARREAGLELEGVEAIRIAVVFHLPRPRSLARGVVDCVKKPDVDKCLRAVLDALTGIVYRDDSQVVKVVAEKVYAPASSPGRLEVWVESGGRLLEPVPVRTFEQVLHDRGLE